VNYNEQQEAENKAKEQQAFNELMDLLKEKITSYEEQEKVISLWVAGTFASYWEGWHSARLLTTAEKVAN
jgi:hypothetical protein